MTANKSRKEAKTYTRYYSQHSKSPKSDECIFCAIDASAPQFVSETKSFKVIKNIHPYSLWDDYGVDDHLMIIPKRHIDRLSHLTTSEQAEFFDILAGYEAKGYNLYARAPGFAQKSIHHQHSHLIRPNNKRQRALLHLRKPYIRWVL